MSKLQTLIVASLVALAAGFFSSEAHAFGGRYYSGGHPYHNGFLFIPPSSAYEAVTLRPPFRYGVPAYYYPASYLAPGFSYYPPPVYPAPAWRSAGYYMSTYSLQSVYPWYPW